MALASLLCFLLFKSRATYIFILAFVLFANFAGGAKSERAPPRRHAYGRGWELATATWYGSPDGAGTDGGACGYGYLPSTPYGLNVGAGSPVLFKNGRGCGACYKLKCVEQQLCSAKPVTVVITDECPGGYCAFGRTHFDLSGTAFGRMALAGKTPQLLGSGVVQILYKRVNCNYRRAMEFQVNQGSTPFWLSILVRYESGPGDLGAVELMQGGSGVWQAMNQVWGANWCLNGGPLRGPFYVTFNLANHRSTQCRSQQLGYQHHVPLQR